MSTSGIFDAKKGIFDRQYSSFQMRYVEVAEIYRREVDFGNK